MALPQWFELRFVEDGRKTRCDCVVCGRAMYFPKSKAGKYVTCGGECAEKRREALAKARERTCLTCQKVFYPRPAQIRKGGGKYCCNACAAPTREAGRTPEAHKKRADVLRGLRERGQINYARGEGHPNWRGGRSAYFLRTKESRNSKRRDYLRANINKAREWARKRRGQMIGRLPVGTIKNLGEMQRWKCAVCTVSIRDAYHIDHIAPLARGGVHHWSNLQLLCPTCNLSKSSKDPIDFMQSKGFLL